MLSRDSLQADCQLAKQDLRQNGVAVRQITQYQYLLSRNESDHIFLRFLYKFTIYFVHFGEVLNEIHS